MKRAYSRWIKCMMAAAAAAILLFPAGDGGKVWAGIDPYVGEIEMVGFNFAPVGWATCDGQALPIAQNTALFSLLGTQYGGDGRTYFNLPDLRGRVAIHQGQGPGLSYRVQGESGGQETITLTRAQMPFHSHTATTSVTVASSLNAFSGNGAVENPAGNVIAKVPREFQYSAVAPNVSMRSGAVTSTASAATTVDAEGSSQPVDIMPPYLTVNFIIALQGIFPSRQ